MKPTVKFSTMFKTPIVVNPYVRVTQSISRSITSFYLFTDSKMFVSKVRWNVFWGVSHEMFSQGHVFQKVADLKAHLNRCLTWVDTFFVKTLMCHKKILVETTVILESFGNPRP